MTYLPGVLTQAKLISRLMLPIGLVFLPMALTLWFRHTALRRTERDRTAVWLGYRRLNRFIMTATMAGWPAVWDLNGRLDVIPTMTRWWLSSLAPSDAEVLFFWFPPIVGLSLHLVLSYSTDKTFLSLRWTPTDIVRQAWWRMVSFVVPLLMLARGFDAIFDGKQRGVVWIMGAGLIAKIGTIFLQRAEGMKLHEAKSGELRNRAFSIARRMGTTIQRVYIVPAGKGHLTNAYGTSGAIGVTDNLGKYFTRPEVEYVMAHEVAHAKQRHGLKTVLFAMALFSAMTLLLFRLPIAIQAWRPLLDFVVISAPVAAFYFLLRHFEYAADREAVNFTGAPETAIRALARLYQVSAVPVRCSRFTELFLTHPALTRRAQAIAQAGQLPPGRVADILQEAGISEGAAPHQ